MSEVLLVAVSDLHLDHKPPGARAERGSRWYDAMKRQLTELREVCEEYDCPLVVAGDVFNDGWRTTRTPPELVNFAIDQFSQFPKEVYAVPGQHDLPYHRYNDMKRSAYWTLVKSKVVTHLPSGHVFARGSYTLEGVPWGCPVPERASKGSAVHIAVVHRYCWWADRCHPGCDPKDNVAHVPNQFPGYGVVLFGDNHKGFQTKVGGASVSNCGTFMRRGADEKEYVPFATLVHKDGSVSRHDYLSTSEDEWVSYLGSTESTDAVSKFADALEGIKVVWESFPATVREEMKRQNLDPAVRRAVLECLED